VLFTSPGERVNRPTFGSGLLKLVFEPAGDELATATRFLVQGALQQWLGDLIQVQRVEVDAGEGVLAVEVQYLVRRTGQFEVARFTRPEVSP
jgi:phage baseplate assembly protein W